MARKGDTPADEDLDAREQRWRALHALAQQQAGTALPDSEGQQQPSDGLGHTSRRRRPRLWQIGGLLVLVAAVVIAALAGTRHGAPAPPRTSQAAPVEILPHLSGFDCPQSMAWSPDGTRVALLGYVLQCPVELMQREYDSGPAFAPFDSPTGRLLSDSHGATPLTGLLVVYDSNRGKELLRLHLDAAIQKLFPIPSSVAQVYASINATPLLEIHYTHVLWVPNSSTLAITFTTFVPSGPPPTGVTDPWPGTAVYGVLLASQDGSLRVISHTSPYPGPAPTLEWDLTTGRLIALPAALISQSSRSSLAPALAYAWGANSAITAEQPLGASGATVSPTPSTALMTPVGDPDGGAGFTIWQPGQFSYTQSPTGAQPVASWSTDFAAISPDGRFLLVAMSLAGDLDTQGAAVGEASRTLTLPVRDSGLRTFWANLAQDQRFGTANASWRPDGKVLAIQSVDADSSSSPNAHRVLLFDCQTGAQLAALIPYGNGLPAVASGEWPLLSWSPSGTRLFLFDPGLGTATIWSPTALSHG